MLYYLISLIVQLFMQYLQLLCTKITLNSDTNRYILRIRFLMSVLGAFNKLRFKATVKYFKLLSTNIGVNGF